MKLYRVIAPLVAVVCVCLLEESACFSNGQVAPSCGTMTPGHPPFTASERSAPFVLSTSSDTYRESGVITVTLKVLNSSNNFQGFLLQARSWEGGVLQWPVGRFINVDHSNFNTLNCNNKENSTVSQASGVKKKKIQLTWEAPNSRSHGEIFFCATVVQDYTTFWLNVSSKTLTQASSGNSGMETLCFSPLLLITMLLTRLD